MSNRNSTKLLLALIITGCVGVLSLQYIRNNMRTMGPEAKEIINIFEDEELDKGLPIPTPKLQDLVLTCCQSKQRAIEVFEEAGFDVKVIASDTDALNEHWKTKDHPYDEFISATRMSSRPRISSLNTSYQVVLFANDGKVERVWSRIDRTMP